MALEDAEHKDGSVVISANAEQAKLYGVPKGTAILTSYVEPTDEVREDENYYYTSGPRDARGYITDRETKNDDGKAAKKTATKKSSSK